MNRCMYSVTEVICLNCCVSPVIWIWHLLTILGGNFFLLNRFVKWLIDIWYDTYPGNSSTVTRARESAKNFQ